MLKIFLLFVSSFFLALSLSAAVCRPLGSPSALITCIANANLSPQDDVIDLGGLVYTLTAPNNADNGLPIILSTGGKLSVINGIIKRSTTNTSKYRFFQTNTGANLSLFNITLEFGSTITAGAAISNNGELTLENCILANNTATNNGGAISNSSTGIINNIQNCVISGNSAPGFAGGGIYNHGIINYINNTTVSGNNALNAGGISNDGAASTIFSLSNSTVSGNSATSAGGGIFNSGVVNIYTSTIANNTAANFGGGIDNNKGTLQVYNSTITGNQAVMAGGGIYNLATISSLISNIIASNTSATNLGPDIYNITGTISSESYNLISSTNSNSIVNGVHNDIVTTTPFLGPLQANGGPTFTIALLPGSLAINNGNNPLNFEFDQRGSLRIFCAMPDIGAYELEPCQILKR